MSFVQNFPFFSIILSLVCAVVSFAANARWARRLSIFLLSASAVLQGSLLVYCTVHHVRYSYMMGHYPAPWGNELTAGILEPFLAMLFAGVMLLCVLGGMGRILRDVPADRQKLYWVMVDLAHVALMALCYTNDIFTGYVFIEVLTIASCALLSVRRGGRALIASARYMIFALMGSGLFLIGVIFTYSVTGHLLFPQLHTAIADLWASGGHRFSVTMSLGPDDGRAWPSKAACFPSICGCPIPMGRPLPPPRAFCPAWCPRGISCFSSRSSTRSSASTSLLPPASRRCCCCSASAA